MSSNDDDTASPSLTCPLNCCSLHMRDRALEAARPLCRANNRRGRKANCGGEVVGKKLKLGGKGCETAAEEGGLYEFIEDRDFARLASVGGEEGEQMW
jgi:hypothetical protein